MLNKNDTFVWPTFYLFQTIDSQNYNMKRTIFHKLTLWKKHYGYQYIF